MSGVGGFGGRKKNDGARISAESFDSWRHLLITFRKMAFVGAKFYLTPLLNFTSFMYTNKEF